MQLYCATKVLCSSFRMDFSPNNDIRVMTSAKVKVFLGDPGEWDRWLDDFGGASAYQYQPFIGLHDRRVQVMSGPQVLGGGVVVSAPVLGWPQRILTLHRGPVGDLLSLLGPLEAWARDQGAWCLELMPDTQMDSDRAAVMSSRNWQLASGARHTLRLELRHDESTLLGNLESRARYQIKRGERDGIVVRSAQNNDDVASFCRLYAEMIAEKNLHGGSESHLSNLGRYLIANPNRGTILLAEYEGSAIGTNLLWRSASRVENLYGASRKQKIAVGYPLQWASIMWAKAGGAAEYDFGGYDPNLNGGPALMKRAFCNNIVPLSPRWRKVFNPILFNTAFWLRRRLIR